MDNKGRVTVVLHWDQRPSHSGGITGNSTGSTIINSSSTCNGPLLDKFSPSKKSGGISAQSSIDKSAMQQRYPSPQITVINHDDIQSTIFNSNRRLSKQGIIETKTHLYILKRAHININMYIVTKQCRWFI